MGFTYSLRIRQVHVGYRSGYAMAGRTYFKLEIQGSGWHGSSPHLANDSIVAGAHFVTASKRLLAVV